LLTIIVLKLENKPTPNFNLCPLCEEITK
jgi:hypothetical protein